MDGLAFSEVDLQVELVDGHRLSSARLDTAALRASDCVIITTAHSTYDWDWVVASSDLVLDTRNATAGVDSSEGRVIKL